jgi:hypothetical protein
LRSASIVALLTGAVLGAVLLAAWAALAVAA